ncbi:Cytochrome P450 monooxygenase -like protein [Cladobotryum mycophilum]|uniref:Cytochrome P450 monooxygenase -like protein n=1 Tax=Cladobotryum mycophilum TaxID=491253 RepID=A0ABR0STN9_9HYPO
MAFLNELWSGVTDGLINTQQSITLAAIATLLIVLFTTKAISGNSVSVENNGKQKIPPVSTHWIPFIGNTPFMIIGREGFLAGLRDRYEGIFSFTMMGKMHHFVYKPSLVTALFNLQRPAEEDQTMTNRILTSTFGLPKADQNVYNSMLEDARAQYRHLLSEPGLSEITNVTLRLIKRRIADLVTFNSYPADQAEWERLADADVIENADGKGGSVVEADFMELIRNFVAHTASPAIFGTDFVENFPDVFKWIWTFDKGFVMLAAGVPTWVPLPRLQRGKQARRRIQDYMYEFNQALEKHMDGQDPGPRWQDLDNVGRVVKGRAEEYRKHGMSLDGRAALDLALLWSTTANSSPLIAWMLFEIYRDAVLLEQIREEIAPYMKAVQPKNEFGPGVWVQPELETVDLDGLLTKCPLLKAAYVETLRLYTSVWMVKWMYHDTVLDERGKDGESYLLEKGSYAHMPLELHQFDPTYFPEPNEWRAERHIKEVVDENGEKTLTADLGTIKPYSGGVKMCKGRAFALREMLLFTSSIITFYDMQPAKGGRGRHRKR